MKTRIKYSALTKCDMPLCCAAFDLLQKSRMRNLSVLFLAIFLFFVDLSTAYSQTWVGPDGGQWGDPSNWLGLGIPGDLDDEDFVPGGSVFIRGPFPGETDRGTIKLEDKTYSVGIILIDGTAGARLDDGKIILDHPESALIFVRDGGLEAGPDLTIELTSNNGQPIQMFIGEDDEFVVEGIFSGPGGLEAVGPGTLILNNLNTFSGAASVSAGVLRISGGGAIAGDASVGVGGALINDGTISGGVNSAGTLDTAGHINGNLLVTGGSVLNTGTVTGAVIVSGGTLNIDGGTYGAGITNQTGGTLNAQGLLAGDNRNITNAGTMNVTGMFKHGGNLTNTGTLTLGADYTGIETMTLGGAVTTTGPHIRPTLQASIIESDSSGRLDLRGFDALHSLGRQLNVEGDLVGVLRVELAPELVDRTLVSDIAPLDWNGTLSNTEGALVLDFGAQDRALQIGKAIPVLTVGDPTRAVTAVSATGLPDMSGLVSAVLRYDAANQTFNLITLPNPAIGGMVGTFSAVESLIGTAIDRPDRAVFSRSGSRSVCSSGGWARSVGGRTRVRSDTTLVDQNLSKNSEVRVNYHGIQGGFDLGCYNAPQGWDITAGLSFGVHQGETSQDVFNFNVDPISGVVAQDALASVTRSDFRQAFGSVYLAAKSGDWFGEAQLTRARNRYIFRNTAEAGSRGVPLLAQRSSSDTTAFVASISRDIALRQGVSLTPTVGVAINRSSGGTLDFVGADGLLSGRLDISRHTQHLAFVGAELRHEDVSPGYSSANSRFIGLKLYGDFSPERRTTFTQLSPSGSPIGQPVDLLTARQGGFADLSAGIDHFRRYQTDAGVKQINLSLRGNLRFSRNLLTYGVAAQAQMRF
ncbi:hypothetical protein [Roseinatronobacter sp. NSM]|uniref:hypothetical protein n=1 Tax=Roseinatronobacter sp. NSM TaxID=3457785 RepID=UPI0040371C40